MAVNLGSPSFNFNPKLPPGGLWPIQTLAGPSLTPRLETPTALTQSPHVVLPDGDHAIATIDPQLLAQYSHIPHVSDGLATFAPTLSPLALQKQKLGITGQTLARVNQGKNVTDYQLGISDNTLKKVGGLALATLAAIGTGSLWGGFKEFLGMASWFGLGMTVPSLLIDQVVKAKTGLDLGQAYTTSYNGGERKPTFLDPQYIPLHALPEGQLNQFAQATGLNPANTSGPQANEYQRHLRETVQKAAAQRNALWMLTAGGLTPTIASVFCHLLEPVLEPVVLETAARVKGMGLWLPAFGPLGKAQQVETFVQQVVGEKESSLIAQWWRGLGPDLVKDLNLPANKALKLHELLDPGHALYNPEGFAQAIAEHWVNLPAGNRQVLQKTLHQKANQLVGLSQRLQGVFQPAETKLRKDILDILTPAFEAGKLDGDLTAELMDSLKDPTLQGPVWGKRYFEKLSFLLEKTEKTLTHVLGDDAFKLEAPVKALENMIDTRTYAVGRLMDSMSSVAHLSRVLEVSTPKVGVKANVAEVLHWLRAPKFAGVRDAFERGILGPMLEVLNHGSLKPQSEQIMKNLTYGAYSNLHEVARLMNQNQLFGHATSASGAAPLNLLEKALKNATGKGLWRRNVGLTLAGFGVVSAGFAALFIGNRKKTEAPAATVTPLAAPLATAGLPQPLGGQA